MLHCNIVRNQWLTLSISWWYCIFSLSLQTTRQKHLDSVMPKLDRLACLQGELRDCVSPSDVKTSQQSVWQIRQQHSEIDHRLALKCRQLESELEMWPLFKERYNRFMGWAEDLERRLETLQESAKVSHFQYFSMQHRELDVIEQLLGN